MIFGLRIISRLNLVSCLRAFLFTCIHNVDAYLKLTPEIVYRFTFIQRIILIMLA